MADARSVAPINKLPVEILSNIFLILAALVRPVNIHTYHSSANYAIRLSSVCTRWRQAAIATANLWSSIQFIQGAHSSQELQYINLCLERSRDAPLHMRIGKQNFECALPSINEELSIILRTASSHLKSLAIAYWYSSIAKEILATLISQESPNTLHELALYATSGDRLIFADAKLLPQASLDKVLGALRFLYLDSVALDWNIAYVSCRNLVELQLIELPMNGYPTASRLIQLLEANRGLRSIKFSRFDLRDYPLPSEQLAIELPELKDIELFVHPKFISWFFNLPIIGTQGLSLHLASYQIEAHIAAVTISLNSFFQRTRVESLCISGYWLPFSLVFTSLQYLESLRLYGQVFTKQTFEGMHEAARFLPRLHTIDIMECVARIDDIEPGFRSLLSLPPIRHIGIVGSSFYVLERESFTERLLVMEGIGQWLAESNVTAHISDSSLSDFYAFSFPFR